NGARVFSFSFLSFPISFAELKISAICRAFAPKKSPTDGGRRRPTRLQDSRQTTHRRFHPLGGGPCYDSYAGKSILLQSSLCEEELLRQYQAEAEAELIRDDLHRQAHDRAMALEIANLEEAEWRKIGDNLNRPYGEGSHSLGSNNSDNNNANKSFWVYVKGLAEGVASGIGVAICDRDGCLVFEVSKVCRGEDGQSNPPELVDFKALIEELDVAAALDLKRVSIVTDNPLLCQLITVKNFLAMENVDSLYDRINFLTRKFTHISTSLVSSTHMKFVVELARNAVVSEVNHVAGINTNADNPTETCSICFESTSTDQMLEIKGCLHRYCFSCMSSYTRSKLSQGSLPKCPFEKCKSRLTLSSCKKFLNPELFDILSQRVKEASIPTAERIYCPYPKCSTLLSRTQLQESTGSQERKCPKCSGIFCIDCKNLWRQCPKCCHMISLAKGCYHIYCRCGHQFCYTCGAAWKQKKATCKCPVWDHRNIEKAEQTRPNNRRLKNVDGRESSFYDVASLHFRAKNQTSSMADDDSELAFNLQVEEALTASILDGDAAPSPKSASVSYDAVFGPALSGLLQDDHLYAYEEELLGQYEAEAAVKRLRVDLSRQIHDRALACEIANAPEAEWRKTGNHLNRPYREGSSSSGNGKGFNFKVYVKGLVGATVGGVGVAICDADDSLVFELSKGVRGSERQVNQEFVEFKALIEGLDVAVLLDLKRICVVTDCRMLYQYITGKSNHVTANVTTFSQQIDVLLRKFAYISASFVSGRSIKFAVELARNAVACQVNLSAGSSSSAENPIESCAICFEYTSENQMFTIPDCLHRYCFSCMSKHVQFKLLQGSLPKCPFEKCKSVLKLDGCKRFLTPELFDVLSQREKESSIPPAEKVYCPYPKCSALFSKTELRGSLLGATECPKCSGFFCIKCKVPWHENMSCFDFKRLNPYPGKDDKKLKGLANQKNWRQCPKCSFMVSLSEGCYHIYCRCGHEFCYTCGAEWKNKKASCRCPIWDERNIIHDE
ncbi:RING/U-box superfamily protein, partial [Striga asiatica]